MLRRSLRLTDLIIMGIILVQPTAPMPLFGIVQKEAGGHVVTAVLIAMVAMLFTALSYGRMARAYPSAGSAYTYVRHEIHPALGFLTGWSMLLDYVVNPLICTIWCAKAAGNIAPQVPYELWALFFAALFTALNLRRIRATARTNALLAVVMLAVVAAMVVFVARALWGTPVAWTRPFYDPSTFTWATLGSGTALAVLTYIGFDGLSTLSEEAENPRRNIPRATVILCLVIGTLSALEVYVAQLVWPASKPFPDVDTAYVHVAGSVGGAVFFQIVNLTLLVASIGSGGGGQLAGARLLYGMGRDGVLPRAFFGHVDAQTHVPARNVILIGVLCAGGAFLMSYQLGAELLNFGAFLGFIGVNASAFLRLWRDQRGAAFTQGWPHVAGFVICTGIWLNLSPLAKKAGFVWLAIGLAYGWWKTRGFRDEVHFAAPPE
jgi:amino acid transporter